MSDGSMIGEHASTLELFDLKGRVAVVTGGGSGLGEAIACGLADCGAIVLVADRNEQGARQTEETIEARGGNAAMAVVDVTRREELHHLSERVLTEFGRIDILVNSAGIAQRGTAEDYSEESFDEVIAVNLKGTFLSCQAFGRLMLNRGSGSINNIASIAGLIGYPGSVAYIAAKGGVVQLTKGLAVEWIDRRVRVNAIAPALFDTPLARRGRSESGSAAPSFMVDHSLRGANSIGNPRDIVGSAIFLASDASRWVTGHILAVDDGYVAA